jgi:hypothetical protein
MTYIIKQKNSVWDFFFVVAIQFATKTKKNKNPYAFFFEFHVTNYIKKVSFLMFS